MPRRLDHIVLFGPDLAAMKRVHEALGFTLTPRAVHPFGTCNHLAQLHDNFIELLSLDDVARIPPDVPGRFNLGAASRNYLATRRQGLMMTVLASADADADIVEFRGKGLDTYERTDFGRDAVLPDGRSVRVGFSLAFVTHAAMPEATFFCCQQKHPPELFWKSEYQRHANTAQRLVEVVMVAADPAPVAAHVARVLDAPQRAHEGGATVGAPDDRISVLAPGALTGRYPELDGIDVGTPRFVACRIVVADLRLARNVLDGGGVRYRPTGTSVVIAPAQAAGVVVELSTA
jgi:hypothetical protein